MAEHQQIAEPVDLQACEHCGKSVPIEQCVMMVDCWYCDGCYREWKTHFDACAHEWEPEESEHGEPGRYCHKCCGFQVIDDTNAVEAVDPQ
jgi:hypothetical protein